MRMVSFLGGELVAIAALAGGIRSAVWMKNSTVSFDLKHQGLLYYMIKLMQCFL